MALVLVVASVVSALATEPALASALVLAMTSVASVPETALSSGVASTWGSAMRSASGVESLSAVASAGDSVVASYGGAETPFRSDVASFPAAVDDPGLTSAGGDDSEL